MSSLSPHLPGQSVTQAAVWVHMVLTGVQGLWSLLKKKAGFWVKVLTFLVFGALVIPVLGLGYAFVFILWKGIFLGKMRRTVREMAKDNDSFESLIAAARSGDPGQLLRGTDFFTLSRYERVQSELHFLETEGNLAKIHHLAQFEMENLPGFGVFLKDLKPFVQEIHRLHNLNKSYLAVLDELPVKNDYFRVVSQAELHQNRAGVYSYLA